MIFVKPPPFFGELPAEIDTITTGQELCLNPRFQLHPAGEGSRRSVALLPNTALGMLTII